MSPIPEFRADLHCHSSCSDGSLTPIELIDLALSLGLSGLSITDHDSLHAYPEALIAAKEKGLLIIPGVEFSAFHGKKSVHVLAYAFEPGHSAIINLSSRHEKRRQERNESILNKLKKNGMPLVEEDLNLQTHLRTIGRPHIALAMMKKGYVNSIQEAFKKYLGDGKPYFEEGCRISVEETLEVIHQANGLAIIAHPHLFNDYSFVLGLLNLPFDGIECYYAKFPHVEQSKWLKLAEKKELLITGGSDFHGKNKPESMLGSSWINEVHFMKLLNHYQKHQ